MVLDINITWVMFNIEEWCRLCHCVCVKEILDFSAVPSTWYLHFFLYHKLLCICFNSSPSVSVHPHLTIFREMTVLYIVTLFINAIFYPCAYPLRSSRHFIFIKKHQSDLWNNNCSWSGLTDQWPVHMHYCFLLTQPYAFLMPDMQLWWATGTWLAPNDGDQQHRSKRLATVNIQVDLSISYGNYPLC